MQGAPPGAALRRLLPKGAIPVPPVVNRHPMMTRSKLGFRQPALFHAAPLSPVPSSYRTALADSNWRAAMEEEHAALLRNSTWELVPRPQHANVVSGKWIFKHKFHADGSLERYKARWVLHGFTQRPGIDYAETFSPVVKPATVRTVLSLALSRQRPVHQLDVKNAYTVFSHQGLRIQHILIMFAVLTNLCMDLNRHLLLGTASLLHTFSPLVLWKPSLTHLSVYRRGSDMAYLLVYVDDIVLTASSSQLLRGIINALQREFSMTDLGQLHHFLGMHVQPQEGGLFLSQRQYMLDILDRAGMSECKPCLTPVDTNPKLSAVEGNLVQDATDFRSLAGALQYLTFIRSDIAYAVQQSTFGYAVFLGDNLVSWSSKRQITVSRSSAEAEYRVVANAIAEASWLRQLLQELHAPLRRSTLVYCDNISTVYMASNPVQHQRTKHIEIDLVRDRVALGEVQVRVLHVPTLLQFADIFTKGLPSPVFTEFRSSLNIRQPYAFHAACKVTCGLRRIRTPPPASVPCTATGPPLGFPVLMTRATAVHIMQFLEEFVNVGDVESFMDSIRLTVGPLLALSMAIRPAKMPMAVPTGYSSVIKQNNFRTQGAPANDSSSTNVQSVFAPLSPTVACSNNQSLQSSMLSGAGQGGSGLIPNPSLPFDITVVLRGPYWIRVIYRKIFSIDIRCFSGDQVWLQPATPPKGGPSVGGSLPCPQFRPLIMEHVAYGLNAFECGIMSGRHSGARLKANVNIASGSQQSALALNRFHGVSISRSSMNVGNQMLSSFIRAGSAMGASTKYASGVAGAPALLSPGTNLPVHMNGELSSAFTGPGDDGGYGGAWVPLAALKKVLRGILKYLGVLWLFSQFPELLKEILGSVLSENEGALLNLDQEQPAMRFFVG
ncbi:hypothetical protein U9M48_039564 [Paspalum notatum var. saurae]|uniref:Reverse transcriptase Ty1/copia-type domain-containing protein n=1 Tax=Paspalum notatum var. saurae TaxID=547442 RepID=A0AAQ3XDA7_PASNO